jgi:hypothetical protein
VLREAEIDAGRGPFLSLGRGKPGDADLFRFRRGVELREIYNELGLATPQPQLHGARRQLAGDLFGGSDENVLEGET